jgi:hypothetical protein
VPDELVPLADELIVLANRFRVPCLQTRNFIWLALQEPSVVR